MTNDNNTEISADEVMKEYPNNYKPEIGGRNKIIAENFAPMSTADNIVNSKGHIIHPVSYDNQFPILLKDRPNGKQLILKWHMEPKIEVEQPAPPSPAKTPGLVGAFAAAAGQEPTLKITYPRMRLITKSLFYLAKEGVIFSADDFINTREDDISFMDVATKAGYISSIFELHSWIGRADDMQKLWDATPKAGQVQVTDFEDRITNLRVRNRPKFVIPDKLNKTELFARDVDGFCPFDDPRTWHQWDDIVIALSNVNAPDENVITKAELLQNGANGKSFIESSTDVNVFYDKIRPYLKEHDDALTRKELIDLDLKNIVRTLDSKFKLCKGYTALKDLANDPIVDVNQIDGTGNVTKLMSVMYDNVLDFVDVLLEAGANPDLRVGPEERSALYHAIHNKNTGCVKAIVTALEDKYKDEPTLLLEALTCICEGHSIDRIETELNFDRACIAIVKNAIDKIIDPILDMSISEMLEHVHKTRKIVHIVMTADRLDDIFHPDRWEGDPKGMKQLADSLPESEIQFQLSGQDGRPDFASLLSGANASVIKSMTGYDDEPESP